MKVVFSIVIPVFNVEKYLSQCLDSVLSQKFTSFEVVLVNDGSIDSSGHICDKYSGIYDNVFVLHQKNKGQSVARNNGLKVAKGEYVFFIDSDDYLIHENVFDQIYLKLISSPDVVLFKFQKFYDKKNTMLKCNYEFPDSLRFNNNVELLCELNNLDCFYNSPWSKVVKRKLLIDNNILFEADLLGEDNDWFYKVVVKAEKYILINESFVAYRQRINSITSSVKLKNLSDLIFIIEKWKTIHGGIKKVILSSLAKQYCHALILYCKVNEVQKYIYINKLKNLSYLLFCSKNKRVLFFRLCYSLFKFKGTIVLLSLILKIRNKL